MAGSALSLFTDFFTHTTGPAYLTDPNSIINDAQLRNYEGLNALYRSKRELQGGTTVRDTILLNSSGQAKTFLPGESATVTNTQNGSTISVPWRFTRVPVTWTEAEILLNEGGSMTSATGAFHQFKKLRNLKWQQGYTDIMNLMELQFWAAASNASMEANAGKEPYSVLATVTSDGLAPAGFTTVQNINPTNENKWRNQTANYTGAALYDIDNGVVAGFDTVSQLVKFKKPPRAPADHFTDSNFSQLGIYTNREGRRIYMRSIRANNDITRVGKQDPSYPDPSFNGIAVEAAEGLDELNSFAAGSPGYLFLNWMFLKCIVHQAKFMARSDVKSWADKPDTNVVWVECYHNTFNCSRQRHGFLSAA